MDSNNQSPMYSLGDLYDDSPASASDGPSADSATSASVPNSASAPPVDSVGSQSPTTSYQPPTTSSSPPLSPTTSSQLPATDEVDDILNKDILELMGAKDMPEEKKAELYQKMLETIQNRVIARIADELSDEDLEEFKKLADSGDKQKMEEFLQNKNIDVAKLMLQEALIYKTEMVELAKPLQNKKE